MGAEMVKPVANVDIKIGKEAAKRLAQAIEDAFKADPYLLRHIVDTTAKVLVIGMALGYGIHYKVPNGRELLIAPNALGISS